MADKAFSEFFSSYYDEIYQDKEYEKEVEYVNELIDRYCRTAEDILDIGCGTGTHGLMLSEKGYTVFGIDASEGMVSEAKEKIAESGNEGFSVMHGEIENLDVDREFDVVLAQFGVIGYLPTNAQLHAAFQSIRSHIHGEGLFVFDTWYGPAVLSDPPDTLFQEFDVSDGTIFRHVGPDLRANENMADLTFDLLHVDGNDSISRFQETHPIRYYFKPEVEMLARFTGFDLIDAHPYREPEEDLGTDHWNATWVLRPADDGPCH